VKKVYLVIAIAILVITGLYICLRYAVLRTKDHKPDNTKARSALDLRTAIIAKLQQLVKDGSSGLYHLEIGKLELHITSSTVELQEISLVPDTAGMEKLRSLQQLPQDIFKISFPFMKMEGINIDDLLSTNGISLSRISIDNPVVEVWHGQLADKRTDTVTFYQRILKSFRSISIDRVEVNGGTFISHHVKRNERNQVNNVTVQMQDILIDPSTQSGNDRKLFAKRLNLSVKNYEATTNDRLYRIKTGRIDISAAEDRVTVSNLELQPTLSKQAFQKQLAARKEIFNISVPRLRLSGIDWWRFFNEGTLLAQEAVMENSRCSVYLDRSLPFRKVRPDNFPHQMLMRLPVSLNLARIQMQNARLIYTEFNPAMDKAGTIIIDRMNGQVSNFTNMPDQIRRNGSMTISSAGMFMKSVPLSVNFQFNLAKHATGDFRMELQIGRLDSSLLNRITVPLSEFMLKRGTIQRGTAEVSGNNKGTHGKGELLYNDLYLVAVEKEKGKPGGVDKKGALSFIVNSVLIKNNNPSKGEAPRRVDFDFTRESKLTFMSLVWKTIFIGILKTIGLPESFADRSY
jgi:hypothetical protein